ncbi:uncharacterized protein LOC119322540 isoform X1 [Triticum dicoccoides]|uniref:uncharacterized protein LOC119322540 isoform X1 n=1 Tax=Triticum dicoccoides TaxID=85692 RepID=UPI00189013E4|nr:uncharacterized protein LOC119322540 isoform X1 [Triticum dicoccoides]
MAILARRPVLHVQHDHVFARATCFPSSCVAGGGTRRRPSSPSEWQQHDEQHTRRGALTQSLACADALPRLACAYGAEVRASFLRCERLAFFYLGEGDAVSGGQCTASGAKTLLSFPPQLLEANFTCLYIYTMIDPTPSAPQHNHTPVSHGDDEELLGMNIADMTSLDDLDFSNNSPGNKKTCAVDNTSSQDAAVDVDNYSTISNGFAFLDHNGHRCENADDVVVISSSGDEESAADNGATNSNSGKSFVSTDSNSVSKKKRKPRAEYNYWHSSDEHWIIEADGMLRRKKKYKGGDVPVPVPYRS